LTANVVQLSDCAIFFVKFLIFILEKVKGEGNSPHFAFDL